MGFGFNNFGVEPMEYGKSGKSDHFKDDLRWFGRSNGVAHLPSPNQNTLFSTGWAPTKGWSRTVCLCPNLCPHCLQGQAQTSQPPEVWTHATLPAQFLLFFYMYFLFFRLESWLLPNPLFCSHFSILACDIFSWKFLSSTYWNPNCYWKFTLLTSSLITQSELILLLHLWSWPWIFCLVLQCFCVGCTSPFTTLTPWRWRSVLSLESWIFTGPALMFMHRML